MFTGLVRAVGTVREIREGGDRRLVIGCPDDPLWAPEAISIGASICCSGVCLTAVETGRAAGGPWFAIEASAETCARTTLGGWTAGSPVNLEPSLRLGDELGGHIVSGHVDGVAEIREIRPEGGSHRLTIAAPDGLGRYIAPKGSVALDGISLTVNDVSDTDGGTEFGVNIIPHTWEVTALATAQSGTCLNLEIDVLARYVARLKEAG